MRKQSRETLALCLLLILGLGLRFAFVSKFPTIPCSDFSALVDFGQDLHLHGIFSNSRFWEAFNAGLPLLLSVLFHIFPGDSASVARLATALVCGLLPILPFLIWRGVLPFSIRLVAGAALALWPGQIFFSGVVAQDNWILFPTVALACLAVKTLAGGPPRLLIAGLLLAAGVAIRQEMLIPMLPLFLAAAGITLRSEWRRMAAAALVIVLPLATLAAYRGTVTGRFALSTEGSGMSPLGAYVPGATAGGWINPYSYIASVRPDLLRDRKAMLSQASTLALHEALRRPRFHLARIVVELWSSAVTGEGASMFWSVGSPEALPPSERESGVAFSARVAQPLRYEMAGIQGLFLGAILIGFWRRSPAVLVLASAALLKLLIHAAIVIQGRYFFAATALEILTIVWAMDELRTAPKASTRRRILGLTVGVAVVFSLGLLLFRFPLEIYLQQQDTDVQRTYRFPIAVQDHGAAFDCVVNHGLLVSLVLSPGLTQNAAIRTLQGDPPWGDSAAAICELTGTGPPRPLTLQVLDPYAPGGFPGRMLQRVEVDGVEVYSHDIAQDPGSGWANIPLGDVGEGTRRKVVIEVKAIHPEPGPGWGNAAVTTFQLSRK